MKQRSSAGSGERVWIDANGNGVQDAGERGADGGTVTLKTASADGKFRRRSTVAAATTPDANGNCLFDNLGAGEYEAQFGSLANYMFTGYHAGADTTVDLDANAKGCRRP